MLLSPVKVVLLSLVLGAHGLLRTPQEATQPSRSGRGGRIRRRIDAGSWNRAASSPVAAGPARGGTGHRALLVREGKTLDEEYDEIDNMVMQRPPNVKATKVKMFGVWLDEDVAGRKVGKVKPRDGIGGGGGELSNEEKADVFFGEAVAYFNRGEYASSVALLSKAIEFIEGPAVKATAGETATKRRIGGQTRRSGEFRLWQAQAMHAQGDATGDGALRSEARQMLRELKDHPDRSVKVVAAEILYVFEAPQLELSEDMKVAIPDLSALKMDKYDPKRRTRSKQNDYAVIEKGPEKYSIEWVKEQRLEGPAPMDLTLPLLVAALSGASLAFFANNPAPIL